MHANAVELSEHSELLGKTVGSLERFSLGRTSSIREFSFDLVRCAFGFIGERDGCRGSTQVKNALRLVVLASGGLLTGVDNAQSLRNSLSFFLDGRNQLQDA